MTGIFLSVAALASGVSMAVSTDGLVVLPLVLMPLLALYWLALRVRRNQAAGWLVFGGSFIIVAPMLMFVVEIAISTQRAPTGEPGVGFGLLVLLGPLAQLGAVALLFLLVSLLASSESRNLGDSR
ncbi:MAG: hypothetical protein AB7Q29_15825 [Vicinamibacterales bacterium]